MKVCIHVLLRGKSERFERETDNLQKIIDFYEGKVGTVTAIYDTVTNEKLFPKNHD